MKDIGYLYGITAPKGGLNFPELDLDCLSLLLYLIFIATVKYVVSCLSYPGFDV